MRMLSFVGLLGCTFVLTGCQHLHLTPTAAPTTEAATETPKAKPSDVATNSTVTSKVKGAFTSLYTQLPWAKNNEAMHDYVAACLAQSRLYQPVLAGNVIHTARYALVTLQRQDNVLMGGELCIVNKITHTVEVTAVDTLQFVPKPTQAPAP